MSNLQEKADQEFLENYSVPIERAQEIRARVQRLREAGWVESLILLANELGVDAPKEASGETLALPGMEGDSAKDITRVFACPTGHLAQGLSISCSGNSLRVIKDGTSVLEVAYLPKDDDFLVYHLDDSRFDELNKHLSEDLALEIKAAKAKKNERQAAWKARFSK